MLLERITAIKSAAGLTRNSKISCVCSSGITLAGRYHNHLNTSPVSKGRTLLRLTLPASVAAGWSQLLLMQSADKIHLYSFQIHLQKNVTIFIWSTPKSSFKWKEKNMKTAELADEAVDVRCIRERILISALLLSSHWSWDLKCIMLGVQNILS